MHKHATVFLAAVFITTLAGCSSDAELVWQEEDGYRWADLAVSGKGAGFTLLSAAKTGVGFVNTLTDESLLYNRHYMNGSGVAVGDVDGDGWADLYFARLDGPNALYRNLGGWRFEEITDSAGVAAPDRPSTGATMADLDGDGDLDLLVTAMGGPNAAFLNDGSGRFTEVTEEAGLAARTGSTTMALADTDGDGDLDLYIGNYKRRSVTDIYPPQQRIFERVIVREGETFSVVPEFQDHYKVVIQDDRLVRLEYGEPDQFYLNDGAGRFTPMSFTDGAFLDEDGQPLQEEPDNWALTARFQDVNGDGAPDLYVCNDFESPDHFYLNDGTGRFRAIAPLAVRKTSLSTMSVDFSDIDHDGTLDFFMTDMLSRDYARRQTQVGLTLPMPTPVGEVDNRPQAVQNMLFLNRGDPDGSGQDPAYAEVAATAGVEASEWSWSGLFLDVDLDGHEDLLITTGHLYDVQDADAQQREIMKASMLRNPDDYRQLLLEFPDLNLKNIAFRNRGDLRFETVPDGWGFGAEPDVSHGLAFGDFDHDGDLDAVVNRLGRVAGLYRNDASAPRLTVRLRGQAPNTQGIGATIRVTGGPVEQVKEVVSGGQYLSGSDPVYAFAAGEGPLRIEVRWRNGRRSVVENAQANRMYEIDEAGAVEPENIQTADPAPTVFEDVSDQLGHRHHETAFSDFERQPLLPWQLSRQGPALAWADLDDDGDDDLLLGSGRGGALEAFRNDGAGRFSPLAVEPPGDRPAGDLMGIVTAARPKGGTLVLVGASNYEGGLRDVSWIDVYAADAAGRIRPVDRLAFGPASIGPLALADVDGDGDLDLFAGGRLTPGRYPEPASSRLYRSERGRFTYDDAWSASFNAIGLVSGAAFGDLDDDGDDDLVLALDWGSLHYFENDGAGRFDDRTTALGLDAFTGWWNGVALGDFDADGRLDLVATNGGWNTRHGRFDNATKPLRLYYGDYDANGVTDVLEARYEAALGDYAPVRGLGPISFALPYIQVRTPSYHRFAAATLQEIIGPKLALTPPLEVALLAHMVFLNRPDGSGGMRFEAIVLPLEAQLAPAFAATVADYDSDGRDDVFLSQNFFGLPMDTPRLDAGRGLWLRGNGEGGFTASPGAETGVKVYGEQRAAAVSDLDGDGRVDLAVTQNGTMTKLYRNTTATPGFRVRLTGPAGNTGGVGAVARVRYDDGSMGPARLVTAGSGYWSQSSRTLVLGRDASKQATGIVVRWPGGEVTEVAIPDGASEVTVAREL